MVSHDSLTLENTTNATLGWGVPFVWAAIWAAITIPWVRREMHKETITWEEDCGIVPGEKEKKDALKKVDLNDSERDIPKEPTPEPEP